MRYIARIILLVFGTVTLCSADSDSDLIRLHYDLEIAAYCGLVTPKSQFGFHIALKEIVKRDKLSDKDIENARMQAWQAAHAEWQNRGLGGFRGWCKNEATEASKMLESYSNQ